MKLKKKVVQYESSGKGITKPFVWWYTCSFLLNLNEWFDHKIKIDFVRKHGRFTFNLRWTDLQAVKYKSVIGGVKNLVNYKLINLINIYDFNC